MSRETLQSEYDVVIIGAGIAGLTCGALLAQEGKQVLVVDKEQSPGGFARDFKYGPYTINPALHAIMGCNPAGPLGQGIVDAVLNQLGVQDRCEFIALDTFYRAHLPGFQMDVPTGREEFLEAYAQHFPDERAGIQKLMDLCTEIYHEFMLFPSQMRWSDWLTMPIRSPKIFRHANATLASVTDRYLSDPQLKSAYSIVYPYLALPPSQLSFLLWAVMMAEYIESGTYYCQGGFQNFIAALSHGLTKHGGELLLGKRVNKIKVTAGRVDGIELENGHRISSSQVISNIDPRITFQDQVSSKQTDQKYLNKLRRLEDSSSLYGLNIATDIDVHKLDLSKVTIMSEWDLDSAYEAARIGDVRAAAIHVPSLIDPGLAPVGESVVIIQGFAPPGDFESTLDTERQITDKLLEMAEKIIPDLRTHITFAAGQEEHDEGAIPLQRIGPIYGWENSTNQAGARRLSPITPINDLYLTGHWTQPGSGIWTVVLSGMLTARIALKKNLSDPIWPFD